ncbi:MAG TPA: hypothetical protein VD884_09945 [Ohtaekwangia sp.]|nr:hypothetical protein [Ohtaekwangia sp.]
MDTIRQSYDVAVADKKLCKTMIEALKSSRDNNIHLAYLGGFQTIWANHTINPFSKLSTFNEGKRNIEKAVKNDPDNIEIRFVRLSVQKNAPSFLGYYDQIKEDEAFLESNKENINSSTLLKMVSEILNQ